MVWVVEKRVSPDLAELLSPLSFNRIFVHNCTSLICKCFLSWKLLTILQSTSGKYDSAEVLYFVFRKGLSIQFQGQLTLSNELKTHCHALHIGKRFCRSIRVPEMFILSITLMPKDFSITGGINFTGKVIYLGCNNINLFLGTYLRR